MMTADVNEVTGMYSNIEYSAIRWSGPDVFPAFGKLRTSSTANWRSSLSLAFFSTMALKSSTAFDRTRGFADFELLIVDDNTRLKAFEDSLRGYALKKSRTTGVK